MFRPVIQKTRTLVLMASVNILLIFWVFNSTLIEKSSNYDEKLNSAKTMQSALSVLKEHVRNQEMPIFRSIDPNMTGLIFKEESLIRSSNGNLEDKQSTLKPNFAAFILDKLLSAGIKRGDTIAVCLTGSNPGANIALYSAAKSLDITPVIITSVSSSTWGATDPNFTWLDMESILIKNNIFNYKTTHASLGGKGDCLKRTTNFGGTESRNLIKKAIKRNDIDLIPYYLEKDSSNLLRSIDYRLNLFEDYLPIENYSAYVNIGGGVSSVGIGGVAKIKNKVNYSPQQILEKELNHSVMKFFAEENIPVVNVMSINKIIDGVLPPGAQKYEIGNGDIYFTERYNLLVVWISTIFSVFMIIGIGYVSHKQVNERLKSFSLDEDSVL
ncbi:MAG: poly-gamma-glutamate system protein [Candidatus Neomarinimicrobiota bacterium]|nr:poly-gamma-glutamate system protein [Candidatus Neomarinimicrobiota bacterium]